MVNRKWKAWFEEEKTDKTASQVLADLVVGGFACFPQLAAEGWDCLLLARAAPEVLPPHAKVALIDGTGNDHPTIQKAVAFVLRGWREGRKVAVMCRSGANRAPAIAAAAMYAEGRASSPYQAIEWLRRLRGEVGHYGGTAAECEFAADAMIRKVLREPFHA